jgi:hypothetical protein
MVNIKCAACGTESSDALSSSEEELIKAGWKINVTKSESTCFPDDVTYYCPECVHIQNLEDL